MQTDRADIFIASLGVEAYRVGGSVRDWLLGRTPKDADYMVCNVSLFDLGSKLQDHGKISPLVDRQGQQFGWRVKGIEIALPRREENGGEGRKQVIVADPSIPIHEDAKRRDFTFNALYLDVSTAAEDTPSVQDPTARGMYDLQHKLIQTTHRDSFRDDPLRTLRALRFVSVLGYDLTADCYEQMVEYADCVTGLSAGGYSSGTVFEEFSKLLMGDDAVKALRIARDTGVLAHVMPELDPMLGFDQGSRYHDLTTDEHTFAALTTAAHVGAPLRVRWALLFHDAGKPESAWVGKDGRKHYYAAGAKEFPGQPQRWTEDHEVVGERIWRQAATRLSGVPKALREDVAKLIRYHMVSTGSKKVGTKVRRMRVQFGDDLLRDLFLHRMCDISGKGRADRADLAKIARMEQVRQEAQADKVPASTGELAINGLDVRALGVEGRAVGKTLAAVLDEVACQPSEQTRSRDWQMERAAALSR